MGMTLFSVSIDNPSSRSERVYWCFFANDRAHALDQYREQVESCGITEWDELNPMAEEAQ